MVRCSCFVGNSWRGDGVEELQVAGDGLQVVGRCFLVGGCGLRGLWLKGLGGYGGFGALGVPSTGSGQALRLRACWRFAQDDGLLGGGFRMGYPLPLLWRILGSIPGRKLLFVCSWL